MEYSIAFKNNNTDKYLLTKIWSLDINNKKVIGICRMIKFSDTYFTCMHEKRIAYQNYKVSYHWIVGIMFTKQKICSN